MAAQFEHDVFISYVAKDRTRAEDLQQALEDHGLRVWRDDRLTDARASSTVAIINRAMDRSARVIVLWSAASAASAWVRSEAERARQRNAIIAVGLLAAGYNRSLVPEPFQFGARDRFQSQLEFRAREFPATGWQIAPLREQCHSEQDRYRS